MVKIKNISIDGFKGIDHLDISPGQINIITGRNNTGKTSLLQAIDILFNIDDVHKFGNNVGDLINHRIGKTKIDCKFSKSGQASLTEFGTDKSSLMENKRTMVAYRPSEDDAFDYFTEGVMDIVDTGPETSYFIDRFLGREFDLSNFNISQSTIEESINSGIANIPKEKIYSAINGNAIIIELNGIEYPYLYFGDFYDEVSAEIVANASSELLKRNEDLLQEESELEKSDIGRMLNDLLVPRFGSGRYIDDSPSVEPGVKMVEDVDVDIDSTSQDNSATRISLLENTLKEYNILDNLEYFSFEHLVFDERGERYEVPYEFMGDGLKAFVAILWELTEQDRFGNVLLLEEPENNMHPGYINIMVHHLIKISKQRDIQLFITTHNADLIRSIFEDSIVPNIGFLEKELKIIQMEGETTQELSYGDAQSQLSEFQMDLRTL